MILSTGGGGAWPGGHAWQCMTGGHALCMVVHDKHAPPLADTTATAYSQ